MKEFTIVVLVLVGVALFATLMTYNVKTRYTITISLENDEQKSLITVGREPDTSFISLQDTPYGDNIKILEVDTHPLWGGESNLNHQMSNWLNTINVTSYPDYPISYRGK